MARTSKTEGGAQAEVVDPAKQALQDRNFKRIRKDLEKQQLALERYRTGQGEELQRLQTQVTRTSFDHLEHTDKSRRHIAFVFVYGYIVIITLVVLGVPLYNWLVLDRPQALDLEKLLAQIGALIGAPLGFVVGYYFKEDARS